MDLLKATPATDAQTRVYSNRPYTLPTDKLPAIVIKDGNETTVPRDVRSVQYIRTWNVKIEIKIETNSDYDIALDNIALQVENLISSNRSLSGTAMTALYVGTDEPVFDVAGEKPIAVLALNYEIKYIS
jgi:hypothetical protein